MISKTHSEFHYTHPCTDLTIENTGTIVISLTINCYFDNSSSIPRLRLGYENSTLVSKTVTEACCSTKHL